MSLALTQPIGGQLRFSQTDDPDQTTDRSLIAMQKELNAIAAGDRQAIHGITDVMTCAHKLREVVEDDSDIELVDGVIAAFNEWCDATPGAASLFPSVFRLEW